MGMFGQTPDPGAWSGWERTPEAPSVADFAKQQWDDANNVSNFDAAIINYKDAFDSVNDKIRGATGQELFNPMSASQGPLASLQAGLTFSRQGFGDLSTVKAWTDKIQELRQSHPNALDWDAIAEEPHKAAWERMKSIRERTNEMSQAAGLIEGSDVPLVGKIPYAGAAIGMLPAFIYNTARHPQYSLAQLGASFAAQMTSPIDATINLMSFGAGGAAKSLLKNAALNASVNAVGQSILSAPKQLSYRDAGMPYGTEVWLNEIAGAAAAGFAIDAGIRGPARAILRRYGRDVPAGEMFSRNTERAGVFSDLPEDLKLPPGVPVREQPSEELVKRAMADDPAALRELAEKTGAIEDPRVKGALDHIELGGAVDEAAAKFFRDSGVDNGEGFRVLHDAITGQYDYIRAPKPIPQAAASNLRAEARSLTAERGAEIDNFIDSIGPRLSSIGPSVRQYVEAAVENGFADIFPTIEKAIRGSLSRDDFVSAVAAHIQKIGPDRAAALATVYSGRDGPWAAAAAIRKFPDLVDSNMPTDSDFMRGVRSLSQLDDDAFLEATNLPAPVAAVVSDLVPPGLHGQIIDDLRAANIGTPDEARMAIPMLLPRDIPSGLAGGSKIDDPMGPEAAKQSEQLAAENAEAIKAVEKPIKARAKLTQKIEDLKAEIAKLEAKASKAAAKESAKLFKLVDKDGAPFIILDKPQTLDDYLAQAMRNLRATSRTAAGVVDVSASAGKAAQMAEGLTGDKAAAAASSNFERVIASIYARLDDLPQTGMEMADFADQIAMDINKGILREGALYRQDDSPKYPYTAAAELQLAREQFGAEFLERLNNPLANPIETAAWVEWRVNLTDHIWADGVGKTSKALAYIPLMKAGVPLPEYRSNKEFFAQASKKRYSPLDGPKSYLDADWRKFLNYYKTLMPIKETRQAEGFGTPSFEKNRPLIIEGKAAQGYEQAFKYLEKKFAEHSDGEIAQDRRAVIVLGPPGAGKSSSINPLARRLKAAAVNSDDPKFILPEMKLGAEIVHEEASGMAKRVQQNLIEKGSNIIIEKIGDKAGSILELASILRNDYGYQVDVVDVHAPREMLIQRIAKRAEDTGRDVPAHVLDSALTGVSKTLQALDESGLVRERVSVDTTKNRPEIVRSSPTLGAELDDAIKGASARQSPVVPGDRGSDGRPIQPDGARAGEADPSREGGERSQASREAEGLGETGDQIAKLRDELLAAQDQVAALTDAIEVRPLSLAEQILNSASFQRAKDVERAVWGALELARRILPEGVRVDLVPDLVDPKTGMRLDATSDISTGAIELSLKALSPGARLGHEAVHTLVTLGHLSPDEVKLLAAAARKAGVFAKKQEDNYREAYADRDKLGELLDEEAAAHYIEARIENPEPRILSIRDRIDALLERIRNFLAGDGFQTADDVRNAVLRGTMARREAVDAWRRSQSSSANLMFAFAGERARTADLDALAIAKQMADEGADREAIWTTTGWFKGVDGKWRFEIDDSHVSIVDAGAESSSRSLNDRYARVTAEKYRDGLAIIESNTSDDGRGRGIGTSLYHTLINDALENGKTVYSDDSVSPSAQRIYSGLVDRGYDVSKRPGEKHVFTIRPFADRNDANAVLARTTMARISMTPEQRRARPPWMDYDVPEDQQIVKPVQDLMFAIAQEPEPRTPLHDDMATINRLEEMQMLAEACRG